MHQFEALNSSSPAVARLPKFSEKLKAQGLYPLRAQGVHTLQVNVGKMCNQTCSHCHVDAGPDRTEIMTRETMGQILEVLKHESIATVDITGGAPEMNPNFRWFVEELSKLRKGIIVRCNLTILFAGQAYRDLPQFFAEHHVHVVSSLPCYSKKNTDAQRGVGVFDKSIQALLRLNDVGYGKTGTGLELDLVYNPNGAFLPGPQAALENDYKRELRELFGIEFNHLFAITNLPVSRFLDFLLESKGLDAYLDKLVQAYQPKAAEGVMCRSLISVGWDGKLYDCDFNQMLEMEVSTTDSRHIRDFDLAELSQRTIRVNQHCYGCTAGQGSSCGGKTV